MEQMDAGGKTYRMTGDDLGVFAGWLTINVLAVIFVLAITVWLAEAVFGDPEGWSRWSSLGALAISLPLTMATVWGLHRFWKPRLARWLDQRMAPEEDDASETSEAA